MPASLHRASHPPVLTAEAMREADRFTIEAYGLPAFTLMETAGRAAAAALEHRYGPASGRTVAIFCGKGNNGGDGMVLARVLHDRGALVRVFILSDPADLSPDAAHNFALLQALTAHTSERRLLLRRFESLHQAAAYRPPALYVDALLGTGLTSALREPYDSVVDWLNQQPEPTVALDVPTGLHADTGRVLGTAVRADLTVTMAAWKAGLLLGDGPAHAGAVEVAEIGIPSFALERAHGRPGCALRTTNADVASWLPARPPDAHKYTAGLAVAVAGSPGMSGAPAMAATAAARVGAGFVVCGCPEAIQPTLAAKLAEVTTIALPPSPEGGIDPEAGLDALSERLGKAAALLVGCGLGRHPSTQAFVRRLLGATDLPTVVDADGLNALAGHTDLLRERAGGRWILTPHAGEFKRLAGDDADLDDRIRTAQAFAAEWNCVLLLKGAPSIAAGPDGTAYVGATGGPALATAGTGDVLAGLCAGLLAQGLTPLHAAAAALHLGGAAADRYVRKRAARSMVATDLLRHLPFVLRALSPSR